MEFWGKLSDDRKCHLSLADHSVDVACVFRALCDLPSIRRSLGIDATTMDRLAVFALLHDLGKCNSGFQAKRDPNAKDTAGHVKETAALLYDTTLGPMASEALGLEEMCSWFAAPEADLPRLLLATIFHHGKPAYKDEIGQSNEIGRLKRHWLPRDGITPFDGLKELAKAARRAFPSAFKPDAPPIEVSVELEHRFAGLVMLADWLGSHREAFFPFEHEGDRFDWSRRQARKALIAIGLDVSSARSKIKHDQPTFGAAFGIRGEPRPLQSALDSADLPALMIAESDNLERTLRREAAMEFRRVKLISHMIERIKELFHVDDGGSDTQRE
ncbi:MAG: CRISPR-associated endonuclease Cas3'' [Sterolibacterium sp.]|nr:CRISPR-associated endonuclease Cas3'' [Sterolibacterium sp.]